MNLTSAEKCSAAEKLIENGKFEDAEFLLDQVLDSHPQHLTALIAKSALQMRAGRLPDAKHLLQTAFDLDPHNPVILRNLANLALLENRISDAVGHLKLALEERPDYFDAVLLLGQIHLQSGDRAEAAACLTRAVALRPGDADALAAGAAFELGQQNLSEAAALCRKALEVRPDHVQAMTGLARVHSLAGDFGKAADLAKQAHLLAPQDPDTAVALARVYCISGALSEAGKLIDRFKRRYADYAPVVILSGEIAIARGRVSEALAEGAAWLRKAPQDPGRLSVFLNLLKKAGAWQQVLNVTEKLPGSLRETDQVQALREEGLLALGHTREGWQNWADRRGLAAEPPSPPCHVELPPRTPLLDELVLMRFANTWARTGPLTLSGDTLLSSVWEKLTAASSLSFACEQATGRNGGSELLADLAARTVLHASDRAGFDPYLSPDPARRAVWQDALPARERPLVGVFWQGLAPGLQIEHLKDVFSGKNITPVSLQFDETRHQLRAWPDAIDAGRALVDLGDLVNLVDCLDAVVGPDGVPVHIAGALGRKGIVLLQENHEWYWAGQDDASLWYPSVTRIVVPAGPAWSTAGERLSQALDTL